MPFSWKSAALLNKIQGFEHGCPQLPIPGCGTSENNPKDTWTSSKCHLAKPFFYNDSDYCRRFSALSYQARAQPMVSNINGEGISRCYDLNKISSFLSSCFCGQDNGSALLPALLSWSWLPSSPLLACTQGENPIIGSDIVYVHSIQTRTPSSRG
jgi:hypothetical protein